MYLNNRQNQVRSIQKSNNTGNIKRLFLFGSTLISLSVSESAELPDKINLITKKSGQATRKRNFEDTDFVPDYTHNDRTDIIEHKKEKIVSSSNRKNQQKYNPHPIYNAEVIYVEGNYTPRYQDSQIKTSKSINLNKIEKTTKKSDWKKENDYQTIKINNRDGMTIKKEKTIPYKGNDYPNYSIPTIQNNKVIYTQPNLYPYFQGTRYQCFPYHNNPAYQHFSYHHTAKSSHSMFNTQSGQLLHLSRQESEKSSETKKNIDEMGGYKKRLFHTIHNTLFHESINKMSLMEIDAFFETRKIETVDKQTPFEYRLLKCKEILIDIIQKYEYLNLDEDDKGFVLKILKENLKKLDCFLKMNEESTVDEIGIFMKDLANDLSEILEGKLLIPDFNPLVIYKDCKTLNECARLIEITSNTLILDGEKLRISDASLFKYLELFPGVTSINLSNIHGITDHALHCLKNLKHLTKVSINNCFNITDISLANMLKNSNLLSIEITNCKNISPDRKGLFTGKELKDLRYELNQSLEDQGNKNTIATSMLDIYHLTIDDMYQRLNLRLFKPGNSTDLEEMKPTALEDNFRSIFKDEKYKKIIRYYPVIINFSTILKQKYDKKTLKQLDKLNQQKVENNTLLHLTVVYPNITKLILEGTRVTNEGLWHLEKLPNLCYLDTRNSGTSEEFQGEYRSKKEILALFENLKRPEHRITSLDRYLNY